VSALQSDIKSLKANITECTKNEQKALAESRTLQDAVKDKKSLETLLHKKENHIKDLENEVCSCLNYFLNAFNNSDPVYRMHYRSSVFENKDFYHFFIVPSFSC